MLFTRIEQVSLFRVEQVVFDPEDANEQREPDHEQDRAAHVPDEKVHPTEPHGRDGEQEFELRRDRRQGIPGVDLSDRIRLLGRFDRRGVSRGPELGLEVRQRLLGRRTAADRLAVFFDGNPLLADLAEVNATVVGHTYP